MGFIKKAVGGIGLYASKKKSQSEYSGPCQICSTSRVDLYAYEGMHLCRSCLDAYINKRTMDCYDCGFTQPAISQYCVKCGRPLSVEAMKREMAREDAVFNSMMEKLNSAAEPLKGARGTSEEIEAYKTALDEAKAAGINLNDDRLLYLAKCYINTGMNDAAWSYLNSLIIEHPSAIKKIRKEQIRILKKEGRFEDAERMAELLAAGK